VEAEAEALGVEAEAVDEIASSTSLVLPHVTVERKYLGR